MIQTRTSPLTLTDWVVLGVVVEEPRHGFSAARASSKPTNRSGGSGPSTVRSCTARSNTSTPPGSSSRRVSNRETRDRSGRSSRHPNADASASGDGSTKWSSILADARAELLAKFVFLARRHEPLEPLAQRQLAQFAAVTAGLERAVDDARGTDRLIALWRLETVRAINSTLDALAGEAIVATKPQNTNA